MDSTSSKLRHISSDSPSLWYLRGEYVHTVAHEEVLAGPVAMASMPGTSQGRAAAQIQNNKNGKRGAIAVKGENQAATCGPAAKAPRHSIPGNEDVNEVRKQLRDAQVQHEKQLLHRKLEYQDLLEKLNACEDGRDMLVRCLAGPTPCCQLYS